MTAVYLFAAVIVLTIQISVSFRSAFFNPTFFPPAPLRCQTGSGEHDPSFTKWSNPAYSVDEVNKWFLDLKKSLISVGSKGVTENHCNSLLDLMKSHERVRIKFSNHRMDPHEGAKSFIADARVEEQAELLEVRKREIMFGRKKA
jgi:RNA-binding protein YhbY